jgi:ABC-type branched-subunit amino acid transport system permease subunit
VALRALPVVILGGLTSVPGAIIGGLIIGVGEKLSEVYLGPIVGGGIEIWFAYVLALVFLLFRPAGPVRRKDHRPRLTHQPAGKKKIFRRGHAVPAAKRSSPLVESLGVNTMFYRENGQFKTSYRPTSRSSRSRRTASPWAAAGGGLPGGADAGQRLPVPRHPDSLPDHVAGGLGVNILVGYCGQISLGSGAFMAVGAYAAYNFFVRFPGMPLIPALILGGLCATFFGILFGLPSLRVKGLYLAVATLAAQFFSDWMFLRIKWFTNDSPRARCRCQPAGASACPSTAPWQVPVLPGILVVGLLAKNLVRGAIGREWMAIRDMDVAAA